LSSLIRFYTWKQAHKFYPPFPVQLFLPRNDSEIMGGLVSLWSESFPPASKFTPEDIPDLSGKVMIVTGANTGIGKETAKALLAHNAKVYIAARNTEKATLAIADLKRETNKEALLLKLDLSDLQSVETAAREFNRRKSSTSYSTTQALWSHL
jgi:glutamyl-tRNA reductase